MSKTKLALLVFCIAFGVNGLAFLLSHKTFMVEETKNVWLYELPLTPSPLDSYVALDIGPHQGVIGTLFRPNHADDHHPLQTLLADRWTWDDRTHVLQVDLKKNLTYGNGDSIRPEHFVRAHEYLIPKLAQFSDESFLGVLKNSIFEATPTGLKITLNRLPSDFDLEEFLGEALTHPLSGVIHPKNLESLKKGEDLSKSWITSGAYLISKWTAKEIELISRNDFPVGMQKDVIRTLKFQSAPVKNPSCEFLQGRVGDEKTLPEHKMMGTDARVSILWICRSYQQNGFCKDPANRKTLAGLISGTVSATPNLLSGRILKYRIPIGSDFFRNAIRERIEQLMKASGGEAQETSYFFKSSHDTDLELEFVETPSSVDLDHFATSLALLSSRFGPDAMQNPDLVGIIESYPLQILMKGLKGEAYSKVFLEPDLDEKKLPL